MRHCMNMILVLTALHVVGCGMGSEKKADPYSLIAQGEPPPSFKVTQSTSNSLGIDRTVWIQFQLDPQEIDKVIGAGRYMTSASPESLSGLQPPAWWNELAWTKRMTYYDWKRYHKTHKNILEELKVLWIDRQTGEAFFAYATF